MNTGHAHGGLKMAEGFKFIHASDLHLDRPMQGLTELPAHLKPALTEAPYIAASRVFDQAIAELVDFVLLSGDPFDHPSAPPRAKTFLLSQFKRLAERQITIYWSSGDASQPSSWPTAAELPENVVRFSCNDVEVVTHSKEGAPVATIHGACCDSRRDIFSPFFADDGEPFPIAISTGEIEADPTENSNIRYWAWGGQPLTTLLETEHGMASHPGTHQGRSIFENGPCGCLLGRVTTKGELQLKKIETGPIRWLHQKATNQRVLFCARPDEDLDLTRRLLKCAIAPAYCSRRFHWARLMALSEKMFLRLSSETSSEMVTFWWSQRMGPVSIFLSCNSPLVVTRPSRQPQGPFSKMERPWCVPGWMPFHVRFPTR